MSEIEKVSLWVVVNGLVHEDQIDPRLLLSDYLRINLGLTGHHGLQCGFCTPGMLMTSTEMLQKHPLKTDEEIRGLLSGNLCRCTGYQGIVDAVRECARQRDVGEISIQDISPRRGNVL